jgi:guanine nucleotide-binding protein G(I)/G(S)/G(T) subunit beta-1
LELRRCLKGHFNKLYTLDWASDGRRLVTGAIDGKMIVWNAVKELRTHVVHMKKAWVMACGFQPGDSGDLVAGGGLDNTCSVYSLARLSATCGSSAGGKSVPLAELSPSDPNGYLSSVAFTPDGGLVAGNGDSNCYVWDVEREELQCCLSDHSADVSSVCAHTSDPHCVVSGGCDDTIRLWDLRTESCTQVLRGHESGVNDVTFFPSGMAVGSGSDDSTCRIWDLRTGTAVHTLSDPSLSFGASSVAFSQSGAMLFAGYDDSRGLAWDTTSATPAFKSLAHHKAAVQCVRVNAQGDALAMASWDMTVSIWS